MSVLNRDSLSSGEYLQNIGLDVNHRLSAEALEDSWTAMLGSCPSSDVWVFAYGSLMWNPLMNFDRVRRATLNGWQRSFCLRTTAGRGTEPKPGRMLALEPGGSTHGLALRLRADEVEEELRLLWAREMPAGIYKPTWVDLSLEDDNSAKAIAFVAAPLHPHYERDSSPATVAPLILQAHGPLGSNAEYVCQLGITLDEADIEDEYVAAVLARLGELQIEALPTDTTQAPETARFGTKCSV